MTTDEMDNMITSGGMAEYLQNRSILEDDEFNYLVQKGVISLDQPGRPMSSSEYYAWLYKELGGVFEPVPIHSSFASFSLAVSDFFLVSFSNLLPVQVFTAIAKRAYDLDAHQNVIFEKLNVEPNKASPVEAAFMNCFFNVRQWCSIFADTMEAKHNIHRWYSFGVARFFLTPFFRWTMFKKRVMNCFS